MLKFKIQCKSTIRAICKSNLLVGTCHTLRPGFHDNFELVNIDISREYHYFFRIITSICIWKSVFSVHAHGKWTSLLERQTRDRAIA